MPDVIAQVIVLARTDHRCLGIFRRTRRMRTGVVEELSQKTGEFREIFRCDRARLENNQTPVVQQIPHGGPHLVGNAFSVKAVTGNVRTDRRLYLFGIYALGQGDFLSRILIDGDNRSHAV